MCYSTLGVSVSDNPRLKQQQAPQQQQHQGAHQQHKYALLPQSPDASTPSRRPYPPAGPSSENRMTSTSSKSAKAASGHKAAKSGAAGGSRVDRRPIPLTRLVGAGAAPRNHVASLAMSIKNAATLKRCGGATIAPVSWFGRGDAVGSVRSFELAKIVHYFCTVLYCSTSLCQFTAGGGGGLTSGTTTVRAVCRNEVFA